MTDELEQRLRAADPVPPTVPVDRARSPRARDLVEHIMTEAAVHPDADPHAPRRRWPVLAAAAAVAVAGVAGAVALSGDDEPAAEPIALSAGAEDAGPSLGTCIELTAETLGDPGVELAFKGTVTAIDGEQATLAVDTWYRGGTADEVIVTGPAEADTALIGAVPLEDGESYLISASDGLVRSCGQSGPVSPELEALFDEAFGA